MGIHRYAVYKRPQVVFAEGVAGVRNVSDDVCVANTRRGFERTVDRNHREIVGAPAVKKALDQTRVFRGDSEIASAIVKLEAQIGQVVHRRDVEPRIWDSNHQSRVPVLQIRRDDQGLAILQPRFEIAIETDYPKVGVSGIDNRRDVRLPLINHLDTRDCRYLGCVTSRVNAANRGVRFCQELCRALFQGTSRGYCEAQSSHHSNVKS